MKQILQNIKTGKTLLDDLPMPSLAKGSILIETTHSLVSIGTEKMLVEFSQANILEKARKQPERVKEVYEKIKSEGILPTLEAIYTKLDEPIPLGYCNVGKVIDVASDVNEFVVGDRVASNGSHAEIVSVNKNLATKIPESVSSEEATFTVIGSIGLQSIRLLKPALGETVVVYGLGLIGLLTSQFLIENGCKVIGIDINESKCDLARDFGINSINPSSSDSVKSVLELTGEIGCDGVIITASSKSNSLISEAAKMSRKRGRIVLVGVIGLNINRADFYEKELSFQVSCSYGPGRYDSSYEKKGIDYPLPFVRWTEKRNFEAVLSSIERKKLKVEKLITQKVPLEEFESIYNNLNNTSSVASILTYNSDNNNKSKSTVHIKKTSFKSNRGIIGIIGAGNFTKMTMLPYLKKANAQIKSIASLTGLHGTDLAKKYKISQSHSNYLDILNDAEIDTVVIATRHNTHSRIALESLKANKNTFVEKPLAISFDELLKISDELSEMTNPMLTLGYNRRFSPHIIKIKKIIKDRIGPLNIIANMNAGYISPDHWVHDPSVGGGRIVGEACHLIDICVFLTGSLVKSVCMNSLGESYNLNSDNASMILKFHDGSNATINYFSNGSKKYSKERIEIYSQGGICIIDNFRKTTAYNIKGFKSLKTKIDKGHFNQFYQYLDRIKKGGENLIPLQEILNVSKTSLSSIESLKTNKWINI